jgi:ATP-binding protein involved in chromosome partitioning
MEEANSYLEPAATRVTDPQSGRSVWLAGMISDARIEGASIKYNLSFGAGYSSESRVLIQSEIRANLDKLGWTGAVICNVKLQSSQGSPAASGGGCGSSPKAEKTEDPVRGMSGPGMQPHGGPMVKQPVAGVKHIVAVASGKGGVGKSTVAVNLACALVEKGYKVGLMDADIYGPSLPTMMKIDGSPMAGKDRKIIPLLAYGVKCMSIGFMVDKGEPIIWRGPMVMGVVRQFLNDVAWSPLDYLIVDLPPGTGDAQLTMIQGTPIAGAVIVTTPQEIALIDAERGVAMFEKLNVPVMGVVENMSYYELPDGTRDYPFGKGGGALMAEKHGVDLLAQIPLRTEIRVGGDTGAPAALNGSQVFSGVAEAVVNKLPVGA